MPKKLRENKTGVYIFRLPTSDDVTLGNQFKNRKIVGITSKNLYARKLILDYLSGKLVYIDTASREDNPLLKRSEMSSVA